MFSSKFLTKSFIRLSVFAAVFMYMIVNNVELKSLKDCLWFTVPVLINGMLIFYSQFEKAKHLAYSIIWVFFPLAISSLSFNFVAVWAIIFLSLIFSSLIALVLKTNYQMKKIELKN